MATDNFFSKAHFYPNLWAAILGATGFIGGIVYNNYTGPATVVVDTERPNAKPLNVKILESVVNNPGPEKQDIINLTTAINSLKEVASKQHSDPQLQLIKRDLAQVKESLEISGNKNREALVREDELTKHQPSNSNYAKNQTPPKLEAALAKWQETEVTGNVKKSYIGSASPPEFQLPSTAKGYTPVSIKGVKREYCPPSEMRSGVPITVGFNLVDDELLLKASPLIFSINRIDGEYRQTQIEKLTIALVGGLNSVTSVQNLSAGNYNTSYGYFLKNKVSGEFPDFYSKTCKFTVTPPPN